MVVDDNVIESTILNMQNRLNTNAQERQTIKGIALNLQIIRLVEVPDPVENDINQTKKVMPLDPVLGIEMTEDRRNEIYDKIISDVGNL